MLHLNPTFISILIVEKLLIHLEKLVSVKTRKMSVNEK